MGGGAGALRAEEGVGTHAPPSPSIVDERFFVINASTFFVWCKSQEDACRGEGMGGKR